MTQRENFYEMLNGGTPEFAPMSLVMADTGVLGTNNADQPWEGGFDPFGIEWVATKEGVIPNTRKILFDDIADWEKYVHFPDNDSLGIEQVAAIETANFNRKDKIQIILSVCGLFERMAALMGFENALISIAEDPESCREFLDAFSDYKIKTINKMIDCYQPDLLIFFDDIATARSLFMSKETWQSVFKPYLKKIVDAVTARGVIYGQHTCGRCEEILDDYVELGIRYWHSAQIVNDLPSIMERFGNKLLVDGGWDSSGPPSYVNASIEEVIEETKRCLREYSGYRNFIMSPTLLNEKGNALRVGDDRLPYIIQAWEQGCRH